MKNKQAFTIITALFLLLLPVLSFSQDKNDLMRDNGRIYVVVAVMVTILIGLILYIIRLDRKITRIEKDTSHKL